MRSQRLGRNTLLVATLALACSLAPAATAQEPTPGEKLFVEGRKLMDEGKLDEACQRFEQSYTLEAALGSLLNLANCEEKRGRLRVALGHWKKAADSAGDQQKNRLYALGRAGDLEKRMPKVMVRVGAAGAGATATLDGEAIALGERVAVDPGAHVVEVSAQGRAERRELTIVEGETQILDLFGATPGGEGAGEGGTGGGSGERPAPGVDGGSNLGTWGWVSVGVGAASAVGFGVTGAMILGECPSFTCPGDKPWGLGAVNIATGVLAVAGVGLGVTLLIVDAGEPSPIEVGVAPLPGGGAALGLGGKF